jgi:hypothetical protein
MSTIATALLCVISSPYARRGELWETHQKFLGKDSDEILVIQAPSRTMNPMLPESIVAQAYADDEVSAAAEYGAQFRSDIDSFVRREAVDAAVILRRYEVPPISNVEYVCGFDASGGSGSDDMTLAISHYEQRGDRTIAVLDLLIGVKPPFSPEQVVADFCETLKPYRITRIAGDRYAGEWPREQFTKAGLDYILTDKPKSDLYRDLLPAINSGSVELLDHPKLIGQLCALERRAARGGRDVIDHPPNGHDDYINAGAIALLLALREGARPMFDIFGGGAGEPLEGVAESEERGEQRIDRAVLTSIRSNGFRR